MARGSSISSSDVSERAELRSFALWLAALVVILFAGDRLLALGLKHVLMQSHFRFSEMYKGGIDADVLILGDSRGVNGFDPEFIQSQTGMRAFNTSYNGTSPHVFEAFYRDYLERNKPPRVLVIEVTSANDLQESMKDLRLYRGFSARVRALDDEVNPRLSRWSRAAHLMDFNNPLFLRAMYYLRKSDQDWSNAGAITPAVLASIDSAKPFDLKLPPENVEAVKGIIATARASGTRVILVISPYLPELLPKVRNLQQWRSDFSTALGDLPILDCSGSVSGDSSFVDGIHLSVAGRRTFQHQLIGAIRSGSAAACNQ